MADQLRLWGRATIRMYLMRSPLKTWLAFQLKEFAIVSKHREKARVSIHKGP
jgi:hypothetical protein